LPHYLDQQKCHKYKPKSSNFYPTRYQYALETLFKEGKEVVSLQDNPSVSKSTWKHSTKFANSTEHSLKGYANNVNDVNVNNL